jgi:hypothetical protein
VLGPFIPLAASLGRFALELAHGEPRRIAIEYYGELAEHDTRLLTVAVLNGAFRGRVDQPVNYVNAPLVAAERGIEVVEERRRSSRDFTNLIAVSAGDLRVAGTTIGRDHRQWLVSALGFEVEIELAPRMVVLRYDDVPGVIGRVGTLLGEAGVNIANMAVSRNREAARRYGALVDSAPGDAGGARARRGGRRGSSQPREPGKPSDRYSPQAAPEGWAEHRGLGAAVRGLFWVTRAVEKILDRRNGVRGREMVKVEAVVIRERIETVIDAVEGRRATWGDGDRGRRA